MALLGMVLEILVSQDHGEIFLARFLARFLVLQHCERLARFLVSGLARWVVSHLAKSLYQFNPSIVLQVLF